MQRIGLCAAAKNEGPYLLEWIAHHRLLGFDPICVYDNGSTDKSHDLLAALAGAGFVTHVDWPEMPDRRPQHSAYEDVLKRERMDWVMFLDLDEFLTLTIDASVGDLVSRMPRDSSAVGINWTTFSSGREHFYRPKPLIERFVWALPLDHPANYHVKSILRPEAIASISVHVCALARGKYVGPDGDDITIVRNGFSTRLCNTARAHHYIIKSREEFDAKIARGRGTQVPTSKHKMRRAPEEMFVSFDIHDHIDKSALKYLDSLTIETKRMCDIAGLDFPFAELP